MKANPQLADGQAAFLGMLAGELSPFGFRIIRALIGKPLTLAAVYEGVELILCGSVVSAGFR